MDAPYQVADKTYVLPLTSPIPKMGLLYLNALVIKAEEPVPRTESIRFQDYEDLAKFMAQS